MTRLYTNNYSTVLSAAITNVATTMTVESVAALPAIGSGETCQLTITDGTNIEIVTATSNAAAVITMTRGQESTSGTAFGLGSIVELRPTALSFIDPAGVIDFGGATSLEIPNGAAPTVDAAGEIAVDTTITDYTGLIKYHDGVEELTVAALPTANLTTVDGDIIAYNAANNELEMVTPAGGGGGDWVKISTQTASASTQVDFTSLSATYRNFVVIISKLIPTGDGVSLQMRTSTDNGSTYDAGASNYIYANQTIPFQGSVTETNTGSGGATFILLASSIGSAANEEFDAIITIHNPQGTGYTRVTLDTVYNSSVSVGGKAGWGGGIRSSAGDVDAIRFFMSSSTIASGEFTLYGITA